MDLTPKSIDCACVIHGNAYPWTYVENLYQGLQRHLTPGVKLHVFTEADRPVPSPMIKHILTEWPTVRPGRAWWYKMQLFDAKQHAGPWLYLDLDTVIVNNIDWIWAKPTTYFWSIRDFKYLWRPTSTGINSSIMWWDTRNFNHIWESFASSDFNETMLKYRGDQDYISDAVSQKQRRFFEQDRIKSWRWQCLDGGYDFNKKRHRTLGKGTHFEPETSVLVFHGHPKPHECLDHTVIKHWTNR